MKKSRFWIAIYSISEHQTVENEIRYYLEDIEQYVEEQDKDIKYLSSRVASLTRSRDKYNNELTDIKSSESYSVEQISNMTKEEYNKNRDRILKTLTGTVKDTNDNTKTS